MFTLICPNCQTQYSFTTSKFECKKCGTRLEIHLSDYDKLYEEIVKLRGKPVKLWDFASLFPYVNPKKIVALGEGGTPLVKSTGLSERYKLNLLIKDETKNPTNSFRDRAASVAISHSLTLGIKNVVCATNGNMGASAAAYASKAKINSTIIVPRNVDLGKLAQISAFGGRVITVGETVDDAIEYAKKLEKKNMYPLTPELNPITIEGQKTIMYEIFLQRGIPDFIVLPVGSGSTLYSLWKGLQELKDVGLIDAYPRLIGVQSELCAPIYWKLEDRSPQFGECNTKALGILVKNPYFVNEAIDAVKQTNGTITIVSDNDINEAERLTAKEEGLFVEPASAAVVAALPRLIKQGVLDKSDSVVLLFTGSGLKASYILDTLLSTEHFSFLRPRVSTKIKILRFLSLAPSYGYEIWKSVLPNFKFQAIYQHLSELEARGLIISEKKGRRKYYNITKKGLQLLSAIEEIALLL
ncbi:MAG: threonine synthase [Candidatus Odinarchaeota archaeon]|nr:threonine synthase [Candidatus Odinarchaeota archaeon]